MLSCQLGHLGWWLTPARPQGPTAPSALGRNWGLTLPAPPGSTESKGNLLTMGTIHQQGLTFLLSLQKAPMGVSTANPPHFSRSQSSQVVQSISGSFHLGFALTPASCRCSGTAGASHSAPAHTQGNLPKPSHHEAGSHEEP